MSKAFETFGTNCEWAGLIDGLEARIYKGPCEGLNGYVLFPERPTAEPGYHGILVYVPVHGGITFAKQFDDGMVYGFDTAHHDSEKYPRYDQDWIRHQIAVMVKGIKEAARLEVDYAAASDNEAKAQIAQKVFDCAGEGQEYNFGMMLNILLGQP